MMGKEALCPVRVNGKLAQAKAHLDTAALRLSGAHRLLLPFANLTQVRAVDGVLHLSSPQGLVELELGSAAAPQWAHAIVHPKTRLEKLGLRPADKVCVRNVAEPGFAEEIAGTLLAAPAKTLRGTFDVVFQGLEDLDDLAHIPRAREHITPSGALWLVHPKGKTSPVGESAVRAAVIGAGMYESKVVAFSPTHTAMKAGIPLKARPKP